MEGVRRLADRVSVRLTAGQGRRFGLTLGIAFLVLTAVLIWRDRQLAGTITAALGGVFVLAALVIPTRLGPVERAWMALAHAISKVTTPILMGIVYFVTVVPVGIVMRLLGRNPLVHDQADDGFWIKPDHKSRRPDHMHHQF